MVEDASQVIFLSIRDNNGQYLPGHTNNDIHSNFLLNLAGDVSACAEWPESTNVACTATGGSFPIPLDYTMTLSDKIGCGSLCRQQRDMGCCHLSNDGCYWMTRGSIRNNRDVTFAMSIPVSNNSQSKATTCFRGKLI